jgi:hypothetical protein
MNDLVGQEVVTLDEEPDVALAFQFAPGIFAPGRIMDLNDQTLEGIKEFLGRNEPVMWETRIAALQSFHGNATQKLPITGMRVKTHTISVEKSEFVEECKFRHSLNSAIRASRGNVWNPPYMGSSMVSAPGQKLRGVEKASFSCLQ